MIASKNTASPWSKTAAAAKANLLPGLALQTFALAVVLAYYFHPGTHDLLNQLADFKNRLGYRYSIIATSICGGVIPSLYLILNPNTRKDTPYSHIWFYVIFWAYKGFEVDLLYRAQGWMFGVEPTLGVIVGKVMVDQVLYNPIWAAPLGLFVFHWKESGFHISSLLDLDKLDFLRRNMPMGLLATWIIWLPAVAIIYSLPAALQIPLFNIVLCFFSLLYISLTRKKNQAGTSS